MIFRKKRWLRELIKCNPIERKDFINWCSRFESLSSLWQECVRGDWMLEIISGSLDGFVSGSSVFHNVRRLSVSCSCARHLSKYLPAARNIDEILTDCSAWVNRSDSSKDVVALIADERCYAVRANLVSLSYSSSSSGNLYLACQGIAYILSAPTDFQQQDNRKNQLLLECAEIIRAGYPEPPVLTWRELHELNVRG